MSLGVARARGSSCTITSYCLLSRVKVLTSRPPSSAWSVVATSRTGTPRSSARSRSKLTVSSGLLTRRSLSTLIRPGIWRARVSSVSLPLASVVEVGVLDHEVAPGCPSRRPAGCWRRPRRPGSRRTVAWTSPMISWSGRLALRPVVQVGEDDPAAHPVADVHHAEVAVDLLGLRLGSPPPGAGTRRCRRATSPPAR